MPMSILDSMDRIRRFARPLVMLVALLVAGELIRFGWILYRLHPLACLAYGLLVLSVAPALFRAWPGRHAGRHARRPASDGPIEPYLNAMAERLSRWSHHPLLDAPLRERARQEASEIRSLLGARRGEDEMARARGTAEQETIRRVAEALDAEAWPCLAPILSDAFVAGFQGPIGAAGWVALGARAWRACGRMAAVYAQNDRREAHRLRLDTLGVMLHSRLLFAPERAWLSHPADRNDRIGRALQSAWPFALWGALVMDRGMAFDAWSAEAAETRLRAQGLNLLEAILAAASLPPGVIDEESRAQAKKSLEAVLGRQQADTTDRKTRFANGNTDVYATPGRVTPMNHAARTSRTPLVSPAPTRPHDGQTARPHHRAENGRRHHAHRHKGRHPRRSTDGFLGMLKTFAQRIQYTFFKGA